MYRTRAAGALCPYVRTTKEETTPTFVLYTIYTLLRRGRDKHAGRLIKHARFTGRVGIRGTRRLCWGSIDP